MYVCICRQRNRDTDRIGRQTVKYVATRHQVWKDRGSTTLYLNKMLKH